MAMVAAGAGSCKAQYLPDEGDGTIVATLPKLNHGTAPERNAAAVLGRTAAHAQRPLCSDGL